jgi:hypothetical protein
MPEIILTRIRRCRYCKREMSSSSLEYEQNPFCSVCLPERVDRATPRGGVAWRREGNYVIAEAVRKLPPNEHEPHRG